MNEYLIVFIAFVIGITPTILACSMVYVIDNPREKTICQSIKDAIKKLKRDFTLLVMTSSK